MRSGLRCCWPCTCSERLTGTPYSPRVPDRPIPTGPVRSALRWLTHPVVAWTLFVGTQWLWHLPVGYNWALENRWAHYFEHLSFFITAVLFWWPVIGSAPLRSPLGYPARMAYTFLA